jgi:hypothetical protein
MPAPDLSKSPLFLDVGDRRVQVLQTMKLPRIIVFGDLLSDEECEAMSLRARGSVGWSSLEADHARSRQGGWSVVEVDKYDRVV